MNGKGDAVCTTKKFYIPKIYSFIFIQNAIFLYKLLNKIRIKLQNNKLTSSKLYLKCLIIVIFNSV